MVMTLKELCRELNSPYAKYIENARYRTAFPYRLPISVHLVPNQSIADSFTEFVVPVLEIKHGSESVQVAQVKNEDPRIAYSGNTEHMKETMRLLNPCSRKGSYGDFIFRNFHRELKRTQTETAHFEDHTVNEGKLIMHALKRLVAVYAAQDALLHVLRNIEDQKRHYTGSKVHLSGEIESCAL